MIYENKEEQLTEAPEDHFKDIKQWWNDMVSLVAFILIVFTLIFAGQGAHKLCLVIKTWIS